MTQQGTPAQGSGPGSNARPGQMTMAMQAMRVQTGPKVLRLCLVNQGRVLEERVIKQRTTVTIGTSENATFTVANAAVGQSFKLFELVGSEYVLNFTEAMSGRLALPSGITDLASVRGQAKRVGNVSQLRLTDEARGRIVIGPITFLFQFVAPPPVQPKPQLPLAVRGGFSNTIDWTLTILAAMSFLVHFGLVGALYSDWMDEPIPADSIAGLVDMVKNIPAPVVEEKPEEVITDQQPTDTKNDTKTAAKPSGGQAGGGTKGTGGVSDSKAAALAQQASSVEMQLLAAFGGGSSVQGATNRGDIPPVDLGSAAASSAGVAPGSGDLKMGGGGGALQAGTGGKGGLAGVGGGTGGSAGAGNAGGGRDVGGPKGDASIGGTTATVPVSNADRVIAGLRGRFRSCYQQGLASDPSMSGKVVMSTKIGPNGEVASVSPASNTGLSEGVVSCIARAIRNAQFDPPGGGGSTLSVPVTFVQQK